MKKKSERKKSWRLFLNCEKQIKNLKWIPVVNVIFSKFLLQTLFLLSSFTSNLSNNECTQVGSLKFSV